MTRYSQEELEVMERIAYDDKIISTRLKPDTLRSKVQIFRPQMVEAAKQSNKLTYSEVTDDFQHLAWQDIGQVLGIMGLTEDEMDRPLLPAIVVRETTKMPGSMYFTLPKKSTQVTDSVPPESNDTAHRQMWERQQNEVWDFDW